ncbi:MAG: Fic family protein [Candidatus Omnitrophota bacterium]|jgi:Fic family protein|nr:MAG: Fic family protein [Candidatus Omnitrophota bacterium]
MRYIHEKANWPNLTWDMNKLAILLSEIRHRQGLLLGRMGSLGFSLRAEANLKILTADVVKSSAIEGEILDEDQVRSSLAQKLGMDIGGLSPWDRHVEGIVEIMLDATRNHRDPLTEDRLFTWHAALFPTGRSGMRKITVGAWRPGPIQVVSGPIGREKVHFTAPEADRLKKEMKAFLNWFNASTKMDPVLKSGIAHFRFVTIHPFEDGNGRIARAIADLALARADGSAERFYSMSAQIEKERKDYYAQLERCQKGGLNITHWLEWFLACLGRAMDRAEETLVVVLRKDHIWKRANQYPINQRQQIVINRLLEEFTGYLTSSKYAKLAKCSQDTALRDICELMTYGLFVQNPGGGRSTSYQLADPE